MGGWQKARAVCWRAARDTAARWPQHYGVLLLSGLAGSGKTTFVSELELLIDTKYRDLVQEKRKKPLILIKANLPTLSNPLSNLVHETLAGPEYNLRDTQIQDLRELARKGKVEIIFLLDACAWARRFHTRLRFIQVICGSLARR